MVVSDKISVSKTRNECLDKCFNGEYDYSGFERKSRSRCFCRFDNPIF